MREKFKNFSYLSLSVLISVGLFACGGGGSTETNSGAGDSAGTGAGTGGCVNFPRPLVGQKVTLELKNDSSTVVISAEREITTVNDTSITEEINSTVAGITTDSIYTETFTIANNYRDITRSTNTTFGITTVLDYTPYQRIYIDEVCEGQTFNSTYTTSSPGGDIQHSEIYVIEAVNVSKTTAAGTFNTFRTFTEENEAKGTAWIDTATGITVFLEFEGISSPSSSGTRELIEIK
jgi:hypothetical protein